MAHPVPDRNSSSDSSASGSNGDLPRAPSKHDSASHEPFGNRYLKYGIIFSDLLGLLVAGFIGNVLHWIYLGPATTSFGKIWHDQGAATRIDVFFLLACAAIVSFAVFGHYTRRRPFWDEILEVWRVLAFLAILDASLLYLTKLQFSRFWFFATWAIALATIPLLRALLKTVLIRKGLWQKPTVIVGTGEHAMETARALFDEPLMGLLPVAFASVASCESLCDDAARIGDERIPIILFSDLASDFPRHWGDICVVVALEQDAFAAEIASITRLQRRYSDLRVVPPLKGIPLLGARIYHLFRHELVFLLLRNNLARPGSRMVKRAFDIAVSAALLLLLAPAFLYLTMRIRGDGGPAFFGHTRVGVGGKPFSCYKFRTMVPNSAAVLADLLSRSAEARREWERDFKLKDDPRVTGIGAILRRTSLDELPQLWNVFIGQMSLVGPRPIVLDEVERYGEDADYYFEVRPGMSGLWQISGRSNTDYAYRVYLDTWYVKNWSLWYDIVVLVMTVNVVLHGRGAY